jgi:peptidoglycan/xylan/chitin deacetylase (PgdA/CDA1 family)
MTGRTFPAVIRAVALASTFGLAGAACGGSTPAPPPPVRVTVDGVGRSFPEGTTFGAAIHDLGLQAADGRLLSADGSVLDRRAVRGRILLNGRRAAYGTSLASGDLIVVRDGKDHTEPTRRSAEILPTRRPGDPERTLATYRTKQVTVFGTVSGDLVDQRFVSLGHGHTPHDVALTFDDGPWPHATVKIVSILQRYHVPATFFEVGYLVQRYPGIVRRVARAGFPIGNHSYDHPVAPALAALPEPKIAHEISGASDALSAVGVHPSLFRPPGGSYDDFVVQEARRQGLRVVLWSVDPKDWRSGVTAKQITRSILKHVEAGSIVLLHDGGGDAAHTIEALPGIIRGIRRKGLGFTVVPP